MKRKKISGGCFGKENLKEIAKELTLDSFIIAYFKILPTDERYKSLTAEQKQLLYFMVCFSPSDVELKEHGVSLMKHDALKIGENEEKLLDKLGIPAEDIRSALSSIHGDFS